ncbi:FliM/FliN family flagellar motor switch protein [Allorhodopirellula solitaria]|uniref:Flagellar motor switch protein n=1 Tax=Allorhodopirellula solitaria TaxID=2527987 RepID=A0A5C5X1Y1_9BACT|nr:FliM/FliN family flagellar motor C-terminal domain-containing protein [Allorhodopirellula solitaria]TWT56242.1 flagellar motor switch protein [Allorhodopirellula solitaria]
MAQPAESSQSAYQRRLLQTKTSVQVVLGERKHSLGDILSLVPGAILSLDGHCGGPLGLSIGDRPIGTVDAVKVGDRFGVRVREIQGVKTG